MDLELDFSSSLSTIEYFLGATTLPASDDRAKYDEFLALKYRLWLAKGVVELMLVRDVVYYTWRAEVGKRVHAFVESVLVVPHLDRLLRNYKWKRHTIDPTRFASDWFAHKGNRPTMRTELLNTLHFEHRKEAEDFFRLCRFFDRFLKIVAADEKRCAQAIRVLRGLKARPSAREVGSTPSVLAAGVNPPGDNLG